MKKDILDRDFASQKTKNLIASEMNSCKNARNK